MIISRVFEIIKMQTPKLLSLKIIASIMEKAATIAFLDQMLLTRLHAYFTKHCNRYSQANNSNKYCDETYCIIDF